MVEGGAGEEEEEGGEGERKMTTVAMEKERGVSLSFPLADENEGTYRQTNFI